MKAPPLSISGAGLLEAVALLTIVALSLGVLVPAVFQVIAARNSMNTLSDLDALKTAISGNPRLINEGERADFGFAGTMGNPPAALPQLWNGSGLPEHQYDSTKKVAYGWVGPYVAQRFVEDLAAMDKDRFGNAFVYTSTPFARPSDNQTVAVRIQSAGADGVIATNDDLTADILEAEIHSTVTGELFRETRPVAFATVTLNLPRNGALGSMAAVTDSAGVFTFNRVTFGFRSLSIDPKLTYEPDSATVQGGNTLKFVITNYGSDAVSVTSVKATYNLPAYFEGIRFGNNTVFDYTAYPYNGMRAASGQTILFTSAQTVGGSGKPTQVIPIRVDQEVTVTPDLFIRGVGKSVVLQLQNFKSAQTGSAPNVSPSAATFTINFSDGSQNVFTVP